MDSCKCVLYYLHFQLVIRESESHKQWGGIILSKIFCEVSSSRVFHNSTPCNHSEGRVKVSP